MESCWGMAKSDSELVLKYRIYPRIGRTFLTKKHLESLQCGLYAGTRVRSSLICKVSQHNNQQTSSVI